MILDFDNKKIEKICKDSKYALKEFGNNKVVRNLAELIGDLRATKHFEDFYSKPIFKKYRAHELIGDKRGITSLRVDYAYRVTLVVTVEVIEDKALILEVNKHYED